MPRKKVSAAGRKAMAAQAKAAKKQGKIKRRKHYGGDAARAKTASGANPMTRKKFRKGGGSLLNPRKPGRTGSQGAAMMEQERMGKQEAARRKKKKGKR